MDNLLCRRGHEDCTPVPGGLVLLQLHVCTWKIVDCVAQQILKTYITDSCEPRGTELLNKDKENYE